MKRLLMLLGICKARQDAAQTWNDKYIGYDWQADMLKRAALLGSH